MIAHCANPACKSPFRYLNSGKLFMFERVLACAQPELLGRNAKTSAIERVFWLCAKCSLQYDLLFADGEPKIEPLPARGAAA